MAGTAEQNVLLRRRQITPQNSANTPVPRRAAVKAKTICPTRTGSLETVSSAGRPGPNPGTNLWTAVILAARALLTLEPRARGRSAGRLCKFKVI